MTCKDTVALLADYLDQMLSPDLLADLEAHLADCAPCRAYLRTYRRTGALVGAAGRLAMPDELKERLRTYLRRQLDRGPA